MARLNARPRPARRRHPGVLGLVLLAMLAQTAPTVAGGTDSKPPATQISRKAKPNQARGAPTYAGREDAMLLADEIAAAQQLDPAWVRKSIAAAHPLPLVTKLIMPTPPATGKNWRLYRSRFVEPVRIKAGLAFWNTHRALLEQAERSYGVPAEIIVGVIGVETLYGQQLGNFRVLDALCTLSLDFPTEHPRADERRAFFRAELAQFLRLKQHTGIDPLAWRGSYAGAMGMPQFMPSSWQRFAVDFDGDGKIDLFRSVADVIGSVANYFQAFGWQPGQPTHYPVSFDPARLDKDSLLAPDILPTFDVAGFKARGALLDKQGQAHKGRLALVELQNGDAPPQYVAGTENFYTITRYNWSSYYAMAVIELGREVADAVRREGASANTQR